MRCFDGTTDAGDGTAHLIRLEQRSVDHKAAHAGVEQLWYPVSYTQLTLPTIA